MKVAQQFIAGSGFKRCARPARDDRNHLFSVKQRTFPSIVPDRTGNFKKRYPSTEVLRYIHCVHAGPFESLITNDRLCQSTTEDNRSGASGSWPIVYTRQPDRALKPSCWPKALPAARLREAVTAAHERPEFQTGRGRPISR
jgi:hypothetical protein